MNKSEKFDHSRDFTTIETCEMYTCLLRYQYFWESYETVLKKNHLKHNNVL